MEKQVFYKFQKMDLEQFAILESHIDDSLDCVDYHTEVQFKYDSQNTMLGSCVSVVMESENKTLLKAVLCCYFKISPDSIEDIKVDKVVTFERPILIQFASFCYGALRGVLFAKTTDTGLDRFVLPPVYFQNLIKDSFAVEG